MYLYAWLLRKGHKDWLARSVGRYWTFQCQQMCLYILVSEGKRHICLLECMHIDLVDMDLFTAVRQPQDSHRLSYKSQVRHCSGEHYLCAIVRMKISFRNYYQPPSTLVMCWFKWTVSQLNSSTLQGSWSCGRWTTLLSDFYVIFIPSKTDIWELICPWKMLDTQVILIKNNCWFWRKLFSCFQASLINLYAKFCEFSDDIPLSWFALFYSDGLHFDGL